MDRENIRSRRKGVLRLVFAFARNRHGNVAALFGILLIPLVAALAVGTEVAGWLVEHRAEQNAADSAAIAAAAEGGDGTGNYQTVGQDIASEYGFKTGVTIATATCPSGVSGSGTCYSATVTKSVAVVMTSFIGYRGSTGNGTQQIDAMAIAQSTPILGPFCIVAVGSAGMTINGAGSSPSNITCNVLSVGPMTCNGSSAQATFGVADSEGAVTSNGGKCGVSNQNSDVTPNTVDPFASDESFLANAISTANTPCTPAPNPITYFPDSSTSWPTCNGLTSSSGLDGKTTVFYGDVKITGNVTFSSADTTIIIENGNLDLSSGTLSTASGAGLTVIFTCGGGPCATSAPNNSYSTFSCGKNGNKTCGGGSPTNFIVADGGNINISAPSSGNFSGVAVFQDLNLPCSKNACPPANIGAANGTTTYDISGGVEASRSDFTVNGASGPSTSGLSCVTLIVDNITLNGNTSFLDFPEGAQAQCPQSQQVTAVTGFTGTLVQ